MDGWIDKGYIKGYPDGSFQPDNNITRAEFISIVNRCFELTEEKVVDYKDVKESHWAYDEFKRASAAGYLVGYEDGTFRPNNNISRQEVAAIITRLLNLEEDKTSKGFLNLADLEQIPEWSAGVISAVVSKGYMKLRDGQSFAPALPASRAEVVSALDQGYLNFVKAKYELAGTYTAGIVDGSVEINVKDVTLENTNIHGNLIIGEGLGTGDVTLKNVKVKGDTLVKGGGMDTIIIEDSEIANLIIEKKDGKVRILAKGTTDINKVVMNSSGKLESDFKGEGNFGHLVIAENIASNEPIILKGNFESLEVKSGKNQIKVEGGTIKNFVIAKTAKGLKVDLAEEVKVDQMEINAKAHISGKGKIGLAKVKASDVRILAPVDKTETEKPSTGGSSGGSGGNAIKESPEADFDFDPTTGTITKYIGSAVDLVIPAKIGGVAVRVIGSGAFISKNLKTVIIPATVTIIEEAAFGDNQLNAVTIGSSVKTIGDLAFAANKLSSVIIPASVKNIGPGAFNNNQLPDQEAFIYGRNSDGIEDKTILVSYGGAKRNDIKIPDTVISIGKQAFSNQEIASVTLSDSVADIGFGAFSDNPLTMVTIPNSVLTIGDYAFADCKINSLILGNSVLTIDKGAFEYNTLTSVKIPESVTSIGEGAFANNGPSKTSGSITATPYKWTWEIDGDKWVNKDRRCKLTIDGDAEKDTDYTITGADDLDNIVPDTVLSLEALTDILIDDEKLVTNSTKEITMTEDLTIRIEKFKSVTGITLDKSSLSIAAGETYQLTATVQPTNASNQTITWESSGEGIVTVDANGQVSGLAEGTATITVKTEEGSFKATCIVTVSAQKFSGGSGTETDPYLIANPEDLNGVRAYLNKENVYFKQTKDIDLKDYCGPGGAGYNENKGWEPIGRGSEAKFIGIYDGGNKVISNLRIDRPDENRQGLFGYVHFKGELKNIKLEEVDIKGNDNVGGLIGAYYNNTSQTISNCSVSSGSIKGNGNVGGLIGITSAGQVKNTYSRASIEGKYNVGGLIGKNAGYGDAPFRVENSYAAGSVSSVEDTNVGGLIGRNEGNGTITSSYYDKNTSGRSDTGKGVGKTTQEMQTQATFTDWDFTTIWKIGANSYPELQ